MTDYRDQGYLPDALLNYLVRLGWSHGDQEIFTRAELIEKFDWEHVGKTGARFDAKKFAYVQAEHLRMLSPVKVSELALPFLRARGLQVDAGDARLTPAMQLVMPRATTLIDVAEALDYFFRDPPVFDGQAADKFLVASAAPMLDAVAARLAAVSNWQRSVLEAAVKAFGEERQLPLQDIAQPARVALTGRKASPGLFEVMEVLGRERTLARLLAGAARAIGPA